jgi:hypothetical protein
MSNSLWRIDGSADVVCDDQARERKSATSYGSRRQLFQRAADDRGPIRERKYLIRATSPHEGYLTHPLWAVGMAITAKTEFGKFGGILDKVSKKLQ